jgi:hypothetical protein
MRRYLPFVIIAAVGSFTLGTGTMLCRAKRLPVLAIPKNTTSPETAGTESVLVRGEAKAPAAVGVNSTPTIFVHDRQIPAPLEVASVRTAIDAALKPNLPP